MSLPPDVTLRDATVEDAPTLARAAREIAETPGLLASRPHELTDARYATTIRTLAASGDGKFLVAESAGVPVGHAWFEPLGLEVTRHVVQLTMAVHPGWQGRGIGKALLTSLLEWARSAPRVERAELRVRSGNTNAMALYRALGFVEEGRMVKRIKVAPDRYFDDVAMGLWLK